MKCVTSSRMQVLWNREFTEEFAPSGRARQGDPISPYLFVLTMGTRFLGCCNWGLATDLFRERWTSFIPSPFR